MIHWHVRGTVEGSGSRLFGKDLSEERLVRVTPWPTEEDDIRELIYWTSLLGWSA